MLKKYLITSPDFYPNTKDGFRSVLGNQLAKHKPKYALYRDKTNENYAYLAEEFVCICKDVGDTKSFLHQNIDLAKALDASGVHLTSQQFDKIEYAKSLKLEVIVSTHTHKEVLKAQALGADAVTYSPVFFSPNKGEAKGIEDLKELMKTRSIKIFALGGIINETQIGAIQEAKPYGFASIRYFY
ncbi:MAG: thiamine phosphate synthase [Sulfurimonas sp.]|nr:thiamine phosphate synthase [Sulfurimonas sp.]